MLDADGVVAIAEAPDAPGALEGVEEALAAGVSVAVGTGVAEIDGSSERFVQPLETPKMTRTVNAARTGKPVSFIDNLFRGK